MSTTEESSDSTASVVTIEKPLTISGRAAARGERNTSSRSRSRMGAAKSSIRRVSSSVCLPIS